MKKIMFNDRYGLTEAVLSGRKTQTIRIVPDGTPIGCWEETEAKARYKVGEVVAVAQSYKDANVISILAEDSDGDEYGFSASYTPGWTNKMFVRADLMPHHIRITNVRTERLLEISREDCIKEGVVPVEHVIPTPTPQKMPPHYYPCQCFKDCVEELGWGRAYSTPQEAYAELIDRVSGKGTWESNPLVFVYDFELVD